MSVFATGELSAVGDRKDPLIGPGPRAGYVFPKMISHLLEDKDSLPFLPTLKDF